MSLETSKRILVSAAQLPKPDQAAGDKRFVMLLAMLAKNHTVDLHVHSEEGSEAAEAEQKHRYIDLLTASGINVLPIEKNSFHRALCKTKYDLCLFEFWQCYFISAHVLRHFQPWVKLVVDSVDLHFRREEAALALGLGDASMVAKNKRYELQAYEEADAVVVVTGEEEQTLRKYQITSPVFTLPTVNENTPRSNEQRGKTLIFIGGFKHAPNVDGLFWFVNEIWPIVVQAVPDVTLTIIGSNPTPDIERLGEMPGIVMRGYVPDTAPYLNRAAVSIAPLRFGAGIKGKVTEAMAAGLPIVSTAFGAQGLGAVSGEHMMIADTPLLFAQAVAQLLENPDLATAIGRKGQEHIASLCSPESVGRQLDDMIRAMITAPVSLRSHLKWRLKSALYTLPRLLIKTSPTKS